MSRPRLALVDASHSDPNTSRNFRRELDADLVEFPVTDGQFPPTFEEKSHTIPFDGIVVTGSRSSVCEDEPWIRDTREWVDTALDHGLPALGICWGHQLLADVLGGTVEPMGECELGYRTVRHFGDALFDGVPESFTVFTTHFDAVTELPPGAELIAENDYGIHGFRDGNVVGIQSHPEYDIETAEAVTRRKSLPAERIEAVCEDITDERYAEAMSAKRVFDNFCRMVRGE